MVIKTVINAMIFDGATKDPMQQAVRDALIAFMAATAQAQAEATKAAQRAGIDHAKANGERAHLVPLHRGYDGLELWEKFRIDAKVDASRLAGDTRDKALAFES